MDDRICIMSIKPKFFNLIESGLKKVEFRKVAPKNQKAVFLYVSSPVKEICGIILIDRILTDNYLNIWDKTKNISGISKTDFFTYANFKIISAIYIKEYKKLAPINPNDIIHNFYPPQNYIYLRNEKLSSMV